MGESDPDRELIERARGELPYGTSAYNELIRRHSASVYARAYRILRSRFDAEEAAQDVFLAAYRHLPRFRFERPFSHWLNTVTLNACRMILRRRAQEQRRRDAVARTEPAVQEPPRSDAQLRGIVNELLDRIDPGTRVPMVMRFVEGYTYSEIAEQMDLSESAVKMRVSRGSKQLRELYEARLAGAPAGSRATGSKDG